TRLRRRSPRDGHPEKPGGDGEERHGTTGKRAEAISGICRQVEGEIRMSFIQQGVLFVEAGDVISGTVLDGQVASAVLNGSATNGLWAAVVDTGGPLVGADVIDFGGGGGEYGGCASCP